MFASYTLEEFANRKPVVPGFLIHRLDNLEYMPPEHIVSPHKHRFFELYLFTNGRALHNVDFKTYKVGSNTAFLISEGQVHHWEKNISSELFGYRILFTTEFAQTAPFNPNFLFGLMFLKKMYYDPVLEVLPRSVLFTYADLLLKEYRFSGHHIENIPALLFLLLNEMCRKAKNEVSKSSIYSNKEVECYKLFLNEIEQNYNLDLRIEDYARRVNLSSRHLSRLIKQVSSTTLSHLIIERRILEAKRLLRHANLSVSEIAFLVGFKEPAYFSKVFRQYTLTTPTKFRQHRRI